MHHTIRKFFLALPVAMAFACDAPVDGFDEESSVAPASGAVASLSAADTQATSVTLPTIQYDAERAQYLCGVVKQSAQFSALLAQAAEHGIGDAFVHAVANELCKFYAAPNAEKAAYWDGTLTAFVGDGKLTTADAEALDSALLDPKGTMVAWEPETNFGHVVQSAFETNTDAQASTAGDVGTIAGALIGGLGGSPATVGLGAAIGKVMGEAANALGNFFYDSAPDDGGSAEEGGEEGGAEGGEGGGEGGDTH